MPNQKADQMNTTMTDERYTALRGGVGLGFRRDLKDYLLAGSPGAPDFVECAPENWMNVGGYWGRVFRSVVERYPLTCHGLSLSLGSPEALDWEFLRGLKAFFEQVPVVLYSEHLSYCKCANAHLYDLLPVPFTEAAVRLISERIRTVQDFLGRRIAIENVSYYTPVAPEMDEATFISAVVRESGCDLLLDVNNVYVNAFNHGYAAREFIRKLPLDRVVYIHMAGHEQRSPELIIDTHGAAIIDPVFDLFQWTAGEIAPVPVLLERDFNFPAASEIEEELERLRAVAHVQWRAPHAA